MSFQGLLLILCIYSISNYTLSYFRVLDFLESRDSKEVLTLDIDIREIRQTEYGYQCQFNIVKTRGQSPLTDYSGYFYMKDYELKQLLNHSKLSEFKYLKHRYRITGQFEKNWYPKNPGQTHPLIYLLGQRSFGKFEYDDLELIVDHHTETKQFFFGVRQKNAQYRQRIREKVDKQLSVCFRQIEYGILKAMILGDKTTLDQDLLTLYSRNGLSHILAISGLHIMIFIGCLEYMFRFFQWSRNFRFWMMLGISIAYLWLLGFIISAIRAMSMGLILIFTIAYDKVYVRDRILFLIVCIFLIIFPNALFSISFLLSFGAVFALFYLYPILRKKYNPFRENVLLYFILDSLNISFSILLVTFPILLYFFKGISLSGFIVNVLVLPVVPLFYISSIISVFASFLHPLLGRFLAGTTTIISSYILAVMLVFDVDFGFLNHGALALEYIVLYYSGLITYVVFEHVKREEND